MWRKRQQTVVPLPQLRPQLRPKWKPSWLARQLLLLPPPPPPRRTHPPILSSLENLLRSTTYLSNLKPQVTQSHQPHLIIIIPTLLLIASSMMIDMPVEINNVDTTMKLLKMIPLLIRRSKEIKVRWLYLMMIQTLYMLDCGCI